MKNEYDFRVNWSGAFILLFFLLAVVLTQCITKAGDFGAANDHPAPVEVARTPVDAMILHGAETSETIDINATLIANQQVDIASELTRKVTSVNVREGTKVKQGALLFQLDDADLQAQLDKLRQQEKLAALNESRLKELLDHDAVTRQNYDEASTNLKVIQAQINEVLVSIDKTRIRAPFSGQIGMINIHPGSVVSTNTILTDIEDNRFIKTEFSIPEKYASLISTGSVYSFTTGATGKTYKAKVSALSPRLNENTRSLVVRGITPNPTGELIPGQSARVTLAFNGATKTVEVSANALIPSPAGYSVFVVRNGVAQLTPVEIGQRHSATVQILSGVVDGDTVVTSNILRLGQGTPISFASIK